MRRLFVLLSMIFLLAPASYADQPTDVPWPWGTECPFPWSTIEGSWNMIDTEGLVQDQYLKIEIVSELEDGLKIIKVEQISDSGFMLAMGRGVAPSDRKIVRAGMHYVDGGDRGYWAIIRNYPKTQGKNHSCDNDKKITVVTLRPMDTLSCHPDVHYVLKPRFEGPK